MIQLRCNKCDAVYSAHQEHTCAKPRRVVTKKAPVVTPVTTPSVTTGVTTQASHERVKRWRAADPERYNTYMRDYRRQRRAAEKAGK